MYKNILYLQSNYSTKLANPEKVNNYNIHNSFKQNRDLNCKKHIIIDFYLNDSKNCNYKSF